MKRRKTEKKTHKSLIQKYKNTKYVLFKLDHSILLMLLKRFSLVLRETLGDLNIFFQFQAFAISTRNKLTMLVESTRFP